MNKGGAVDCELIETCPFFNNSDVDSKAVEMLKEAYCRGNQENCSLYMIVRAVGREFVPPALYPNQTHQVPSIIKKALESGGTQGADPE